MKKRIIHWLVVLAIIAGLLIMLWPLSFADLLDDEMDMMILGDEMDMMIIVQELGVQYGPTGMKTSDYVIPPNSEAYGEIKEILGRYTYHRTLRTLFSGGGPINGGSPFLNISFGFGHISMGGTHEAIVNGHVYQVGYFGYVKAQSMIGEICAVLEDVTPARAEEA